MSAVPTRRLYREFARFYAAHRCRWAPTNPRRLFNLGLKVVYPDYRHRLSGCEFVAVMYTTLGFPGQSPPGLFETFDPAKYHRGRPLEDHFANLFKAKLIGNVKKILRRATDANRRGDPAMFRARPALGLRRQSGVSNRDRDLQHDVGDAVARLPGPEQDVIRLTYWGDLPDTLIAALLRVDRKTVRTRHARALRRLRRHYGVAA